jgi:beta-glucosidase
MDLPNNQDVLIRSIAAANKNTIVLLNNGTPVTMSGWLSQVPALVEMWFPGEEGGQALAEVLFGDVNPSGKLPTTLAANRADYPDFGNFPGTNGIVNYAEGIYVGYRHFDKKEIEPLFPFGYGLSYTTFDYKNVRLSQPQLSLSGNVQASVDVTNTGKVGGDEIVELYVHDLNPQIDKPVRELKGFARVALQPGETKTVELTIVPRDLAYFDVAGKQWKADAGDYEIGIGASSRDIRGKATLKLTDTFTEAVPDSQDQMPLDKTQPTTKPGGD